MSNETEKSKVQAVLHQIMREKALNQIQFAAILRIRQSQISNLLNGKSKPSFHTLQQLKNEFGLDVNIFFD